jgi:hypothetical protein
VTSALLEVEDVHVRLPTEDGILVAVFNLVVDLSIRCSILACSERGVTRLAARG